MATEHGDTWADFSLMLGGPLYQIFLRTRMTDAALHLLWRRAVAVTALAWVPLLVLSVAEGHAWGARVALPFLHDIELHARLLLALPLLIVAELVVHLRMRLVLIQFRERDVVPAQTRSAFDAAIASAMRLRDSVWAEVLLLAVVYVFGVGLLRTQIALDVAGWQGAWTDGRWRWTGAGWWLICVSLPLFQFLLLRWYFRLFIWARLLWQVARMELSVVPTHPDRCGGLGFLGSVARMFAPLLLAQGVVLAGLIANRILYAGARLPEFKVELVGLVAVLVLVILGPLLVFSPQLAAAKRKGLREYGGLAQRYVREYDQKWLRGGAPPGERLLGSADIQSLADLGTSFEVVQGMKWAPFTPRTVLELVMITLLPVLPLTLTMIPLEELLDRLIKVVF